MIEFFGNLIVFGGVAFIVFVIIIIASSVVAAFVGAVVSLYLIIQNFLGKLSKSP